MQTPEIIESLKACVDEIEQLKTIREGVHNPQVKAWKAKLESVLEEGGSACSKALLSLRKMRESFSGNDFIKVQTYITHMEALERSVRQTIQTIQVFGRPEDKDPLPNWGRPKSQSLAVGQLRIGEDSVSTEDITIHEVLDCLVSLAEDSNHLTDKMRQNLMHHLNAILSDDLLQPFLHQKIDALLGHWPEFRSNQ